MGDTTNIAWTDATWNPWYGCHKVSEACKNCYMFRDMKRYGKDPNTVQRSKTQFTAPLKWKEPRKVFTCSWSDFFIEEADAWRDEAWDVIRRTPHLTYQILTKRPERIDTHLPDHWNYGWPNVWLGVTAENQERADERIPLLLQIPAAVRFVSYEPALGPVNLTSGLRVAWQCSGCRGYFPRPYQQICPKCGKDSYWSGSHAFNPPGGQTGSGLDWAICGCESGPGSREAKLEWVRDLRDQCVTAGVPFFLKQLMVGGKLVSTPELDGRKWTEFPR